MKYSIPFSSSNLDWIIDSQAPAHRQIITIQKQGLSFLRARNQSSSLQSQNKCPKNTTDCPGSQLAPLGRLCVISFHQQHREFRGFRYRQKFSYLLRQARRIRMLIMAPQQAVSQPGVPFSHGLLCFRTLAAVGIFDGLS